MSCSDIVLKKKCRNQITKKGSINFIAGVIDAEHVSLQRD